jgi:uncharacterized RDD family membrane protein YckC
MPYEYPSIIRRYLSSVVDGLVILLVIIIASYVFQGDRLNVWTSRVAIILFMCFIYEPLSTSIFCTIGQKITGIRVREQHTLQHISIPAAYLRTFVKYTLGIISFFTIIFSEDRKAIHDFAVGSIVIYKNSLLSH